MAKASKDFPDLGLFLRLFKGREDYFAQQGEDWYFPVPKTLDEFYLCHHLEGDATFGLYVLNSESCCNLICIDIDIPISELGNVDFLVQKRKYDFLKHKLDIVLKTLSGPLAVPLNSILFEETGGRGYHIWVFFSEPVQGQTAVRFGDILKTHLDFEIEFFPKQGYLTPSRKYGNLIKLPLGLHQKYKSRSSFLFSSPKGLQPIVGIEKNLAYLHHIVPLSANILKKTVDDSEIEFPTRIDSSLPFARLDQFRPQYKGHPATLISSCLAIGKLQTKAENRDRFSHSEAFLFADVMLSVPGGEEFIHNTMHLSLGATYNHDRTQREILKIVPLHPPSCLTLIEKGVCPGYCKEIVQKRNEDQLGHGTTPCSVWLQKLPRTPCVETKNILEKIGTVENLRRAFFQLKQYHEYEDSLFFDPFDFEHFANSLNANCEVLAKTLLERNNIPFAGYMPVLIPKKINDAQKLEYRQMAYSSVYDQIPIQAIFNIVAPIVENNFQNTAYGYRWNKDTESPNRIFEDWREAYPGFRNSIMSALNRNPNGFHVCCDIKGYYDYINHGILLEQFRRILSDPYIFQIISQIVRSYIFSQGIGCGLPQGPAYARLLANLYLNDFDVFADQLATAYFRYVDDFVLIFKNEAEAELALERIIRYLAALGLELSQDDAKKPVVKPNTDIANILKTLDKIHYGILEGTRHVEHLAPKAAEDFMSAVKRHSISPVNLEDLIKINEVLPSLLYIVSQESLFTPKLKPLILDIIEFLIQHGWFYPNNLKKIFYRLIQLESNEDRLLKLFESMEPTHKIYFLLSAFGSWHSRGEHRSLVERIIQIGFSSKDIYVFGFSIAIAAKLNIAPSAIIKSQAQFQRIFKPDGLFGLLKWLLSINYLAEPDEVRSRIRDVVGPKSPDLIKMLLLTNITNLPTVYLDEIYLRGLLDDSGILLLPSACRLLVAATNKGELFESLSHFILSRLEFKQLVVSFVTEGIFNKRATSGFAEIENLKSLYTFVSDDELKREMLSAISRIMQYGSGCDVEFAKHHREIDRYNECFLFEHVVEVDRYDYLELIPEKKLRNNIHCNLDEFKAIMDDFGAKEIFPISNVLSNSHDQEIRLEFKTEQRYQALKLNDFSLSHDAVLHAFSLAVEIYRKASYFRKITGKAPHINVDNLLVDTSTGSVVFQAIGRSFCTPHIFAEATVGDDETDISKMISMFLENLIFRSKSEYNQFKQKAARQGIYAFLSLFIARLGSKEPRARYSCSRFEYLVNQVKKTYDSGLKKYSLETIYLREQLKGALFRLNPEKTTWFGLCRALNEHISNHIREVFSHEMIKAFPFHSRITFFEWDKRQLHTVSRLLLELALCREDFSDAEKNNSAYLDLAEILLLFASVSLEILALGRMARNAPNLQALSTSPLLIGDLVQVRANDYEKEVAVEDIGALGMWQPTEKIDEATVGLSLQQLSLQVLFACGFEIDNSITIKKPERLNDKTFLKLAHASLIRIPSMEATVIAETRRILFAMQSNEDIGRIEYLSEMRNVVTILTKDFRKIRSGLRFLRQHGRADGRYFPPDIRCKRFFNFTHRAKKDALPFCGLTNSFPSNKGGYFGSWDLKDTSITTVFIPSEGLNSLIRELKKGKLFGFKLSYLYSGRVMIFGDIILFIIFSLALSFSEIMKDSGNTTNSLKGIYSVLTYPFGFSVIAFLGKILFYDLGYWVPWLKKPIRYILQQFQDKKEPPENDT